MMLLLSFTYFFLMLTTSSSINIIAVNQSITDGGDTIVSENEKFELGFFSPGSSKNRYLGIWFKKTSPHTVIWVANRETPLVDTSGMLKLDINGILSLVNGSNTRIWSSNSSSLITNINPVARLLDSGNLVIFNKNGVNGKEIMTWQSFGHPGDSFISGMKMGKNLVTGKEIYMTSWRSADDPSPGAYIHKGAMVEGKYPQFYTTTRDSIVKTRVGPHNGVEFAGQPNYKTNPVYIYKDDMVINEEEMFFMYSFNSTTLSTRFILTPDGKVEIWHLNSLNEEWMQDLTLPMDNYDNYGLCGPYGSCSTVTFPNCGCLKGFELQNPQELNPDNWTSGCRRSVPLDCSPREGFLKFLSMKLPDTPNALYNRSMTLQECEVACKNNCSCTAYANPNITTGSRGCLLWFGDLMDARVYPQNGQDLYVRLAASEILELQRKSHRKNREIIKVSLATSAAAVILGMIVALMFQTCL